MSFRVHICTPGFVVDTIAGYVRTKSYSIGDMERREVEIRGKAEEVVRTTLGWPRRVLFNWALFHARRAVRHRENLRFSRTKLFGVFRSLFRAIGHNLVLLNLLKDKQVWWGRMGGRGGVGLVEGGKGGEGVVVEGWWMDMTYAHVLCDVQ